MEYTVTMYTVVWEGTGGLLFLIGRGVLYIDHSSSRLVAAIGETRKVPIEPLPGGGRLATSPWVLDRRVQRERLAVLFVGWRVKAKDVGMERFRSGKHQANCVLSLVAATIELCVHMSFLYLYSERGETWVRSIFDHSLYNLQRRRRSPQSGRPTHSLLLLPVCPLVRCIL